MSFMAWSFVIKGEFGRRSVAAATGRHPDFIDSLRYFNPSGLGFFRLLRVSRFFFTAVNRAKRVLPKNVFNVSQEEFLVLLFVLKTQLKQFLDLTDPR